MGDPVQKTASHFKPVLNEIDDQLRFLIGLSAKDACLNILAGRFTSNADDTTKRMRDSTAKLASLWLATVCNHLKLDPRSLPDQVSVDKTRFASQVARQMHHDIAEELVLLTLGLLKEKPDKDNLDYGSVERTLIVRTVSNLGIAMATVEDAEKSVAQMLYFQMKEAEQAQSKWDEEAKAKMEQNKQKGNALKWAATGSAFVLGGVAIGLTGGLAAPVIAPALATVGITAFSGAAGATAIGVLLGIGGGSLASYRAHRRLKGIDSVNFAPFTRPDVPSIPSLTCNIVASGFLLEPDETKTPWQPMFEGSGVDTFALEVDPKDFTSAGQAMQKFVTNKIIQTGSVEVIKRTALSALYAGIALPLSIYQTSTTLFDSQFSRCRDKSKEAGILLAEILEKHVQGKRPVTLIGYGPGATMLLHALYELAKKGLSNLVFSAVLVSLPDHPNLEQWSLARSVVSHKLVNVYSTNDWVLAIAARLYTLSPNIAGLKAMEAPGIDNVDVSDVLQGHLELRSKLTEILKRTEDADTSAFSSNNESLI